MFTLSPTRLVDFLHCWKPDIPAVTMLPQQPVSFGHVRSDTGWDGLGLKQPGRHPGFVMAGSAQETVEEEALKRFDSSFRYEHGKALGHFQHFGWKS